MRSWFQEVRHTSSRSPFPSVPFLCQAFACQSGIGSADRRRSGKAVEAAGSGNVPAVREMALTEKRKFRKRLDDNFETLHNLVSLLLTNTTLRSATERKFGGAGRIFNK